MELRNDARDGLLGLGLALASRAVQPAPPQDRAFCLPFGWIVLVSVIMAMIHVTDYSGSARDSHVSTVTI